MLFDFIKNNLNNCDIKIAAHHRRNENNIPLQGYKFFDKTNELVKNSDLVICHNSFACQLAVLHKKPLIFLVSNYFKNYHYNAFLLTCELAKTLGAPLINLEKNFEIKKNIINRIKSKKMNLKKYVKYKKKYINFPEEKNYGSWKTILQNLENIEKKS